MTAEENFILPLKRWLPGREVLPQCFESAAQQILDIPVKDDDVWIVTFPKSGTTWMQEAIWLMVHNLDFEAACKEKLNTRSPFVEETIVRNLKSHNKEAFDQNLAKLANLPGRRVVKSHLQWKRLPMALQKKSHSTKIVYVARHPKDVCISLFYFNRILPAPEYHELGRDLDRFCDMFLNDQINYSPYWSHVLEFWKRRSEPNIFFVWYEEMKENLEGVLTRLSNFLDVPLPRGQEMKRLLDHLSFESMKNNTALNKADILYFGPNSQQEPEHASFFRKGEVNQWKEKMSPDISQKFDEWIRKNTKDTDFQFYSKTQ